MTLPLPSTTAVQITRLTKALYNAAPGNTFLTAFLESAGTTTAGMTTFANYLAGTVSTSAATLATTVVANIGLTGDAVTAGTAYLTAQFTANPTNLGRVILDAMNALSGLTSDATYGTAASAFNDSVAVSYAYSIDTTHTSTDITVLQAADETTTAATGQTFTLSSGADTLDPNSATAATKTTTGNDTFRAPSDGLLGSVDYVDGGAGTDVLTASITANSQTIAPMLKNIEDITLTIAAADAKTTTFDATDVTGATTVTIKNAGAVSASGADELITVSNLVKTATLGILGGTASSGATSSQITATFASAAAADTQKVAISTLGKVGILTLATAETAQITATGTGTTGANAIGSLAATAVKTLNILGSGDLTIAASDMAAAVTVNASTATGVISFTGETAATSTTFTGGTGATTVTTASTGTNTITTGAADDIVIVSGGNGVDIITTAAGNDRVAVGASSNVTTADIINGGDGTDTIAVSDTAINATTKTNLALGVSNFEYVETTATAEVTVDFNALSTYNTVVATGASGATAAVAGTVGNASINVSTMENTDALVVAAARVGQAGGVAVANTSAVETSAAGGTGITLTPFIDNGTNIATIKFIGAANVTGGAGGASAGAGGGSDVAGAGGVGLSASTIETLNIDLAGTQISTGTADTVTIAGGAGGAATDSGDVAGAAGSTVVVGTNATITITDSLYGATAALYNKLDLGTVIGTNVTINGSAMHNTLTVTAADGNVSITGGAGADTLTGGAGIDTIVGGAGKDIITGGDGADMLSGGAGRDAFKIITQGHSDTTNYDAISDFGKVTTITTTTETAAMSSVANFQSSTTGKGGSEADLLSLSGGGAVTALGGAQTAADVSGAGGDLAGKVVTATESAKGILAISGADVALVNTLTEWTGIANIMAAAAGNVVAFEFGGDSYVFQQGGTDDLVKLTGVTGVTGLVIAGSSVAGAVGDVFII